MAADVPPASVELADTTIRVRDVWPWVRGALGGVVIARLPAGRRVATLGGEALAVLARRAVPGRVMPRVGAIRFHRALPAARATCRVAGVAVAEGAVVTAAMLRDGDCGVSWAAVRYADGRVIATAPVAVGERLAFVGEGTAAGVVRGDALTLVARGGAVTVERRVTALQPGRDGGRVFVRDGEGRVFAAPVRVAAR